MSLPDPNAAYNHLFDNLRARVVFHKLANVYGIVPADRDEAMAIMDMAGKARLLKQAQATKSASAGQSLILAASKGLDAKLGRHGYGDLSKQAEAREEELSIKQAASDFMNDPGIYDAVLSLKASQAEAFKQRAGLAV